MFSLPRNDNVTREKFLSNMTSSEWPSFVSRQAEILLSTTVTITVHKLRAKKNLRRGGFGLEIGGVTYGQLDEIC